MIAQSHYKQRHDEVARIIYWELSKQGGIVVDDRWCTHQVFPGMENTSRKLQWDLMIQCDKHIPHN